MANHPLKDWRKARGLSQEAFGKLIGVTKASVSRYEQGRIPEWPAMLEIVKVTKRQVTPNDWLPEHFRCQS